MLSGKLGAERSVSVAARPRCRPDQCDCLRLLFPNSHTQHTSLNLDRPRSLPAQETASHPVGENLLPLGHALLDADRPNGG